MKTLLVLIVLTIISCTKQDIKPLSQSNHNTSSDSVKYDLEYDIVSPTDNPFIGFWQIDSASQHVTYLEKAYYETYIMVKIGDTIKCKIADHQNKGSDMISIRLLNLTTRKDSLFIQKDSTWLLVNYIAK
jgi:hypothetical protein